MIETNTILMGYHLVGTPPQTLSVVFDTGSTTLEFASKLISSYTGHASLNSSPPQVPSAVMRALTRENSTRLRVRPSPTVAALKPSLSVPVSVSIPSLETTGNCRSDLPQILSPLLD